MKKNREEVSKTESRKEDNKREKKGSRTDKGRDKDRKQRTATEAAEQRLSA